MSKVSEALSSWSPVRVVEGPAFSGGPSWPPKSAGSPESPLKTFRWSAFHHREFVCPLVMTWVLYHLCHSYFSPQNLSGLLPLNTLCMYYINYKHRFTGWLIQPLLSDNDAMVAPGGYHVELFVVQSVYHKLKTNKQQSHLNPESHSRSLRSLGSLQIRIQS